MGGRLRKCVLSVRDALNTTKYGTFTEILKCCTQIRFLANMYNIRRVLNLSYSALMALELLILAVNSKRLVGEANLTMRTATCSKCTK